jgi:hypothetical protein
VTTRIGYECERVLVTQSMYCTWQVNTVLYPSDSTVMLDGFPDHGDRM